MHIRSLTAVAMTGLVLGAFGASPVAASPFLPVPPASFLNFHVATVPQLAREVILDSTVRARLANHFHWTGAQTIAFTRNELVLKRLSMARRVRMYCISENGHEYSFVTRLPAGLQVFALRSTGQPVLKLACGNPLISKLTIPTHKLTPPRLAKAHTTAGVVPVPSQGIVTVSALPDQAFTEANPFAAPAIIQVGAAPIQLLSSRIPAALFAPLALFGLTNSHGSTNSSPSIPVVPGSPAPEPAGPVAMSVFFVTILGLVLRRRTTKTEAARLP